MARIDGQKFARSKRTRFILAFETCRILSCAERLTWAKSKRQSNIHTVDAAVNGKIHTGRLSQSERDEAAVAVEKFGSQQYRFLT